MASMAVFLRYKRFLHHFSCLHKHLAPFETSVIKDICAVMAKMSQGQWESTLPGQAAGGQGTFAKHIKWYQMSIFRRLNQDISNLKLFHSSCLTR